MIDGLREIPLEYRYFAGGRQLVVGKSGQDSDGAQLIVTTPQQVQAWYEVSEKHIGLSCLQGTMRLVVFDARRDLPSFGMMQEYFLGEHRPMRIDIPAGVCFGWQNTSQADLRLWLTGGEWHPENQVLPAETDRIPCQW